MTTVASDTFTRTVSSGWGSATTGGTWTSTGTASWHSVNGSQGTMTVPAGSGPSDLLAIGQVTTDVTIDVATDTLPVGGNLSAYIIGRGTNTNGYAARLVLLATGGFQLAILKVVAGTETNLSGTIFPSDAYTAGTAYRVRIQVAGASPATVKAKMWPAAGSEPASWAATVTDSDAALQAAGGIGVKSYVSSAVTNGPIAFRWDNLAASDGATGSAPTIDAGPDQTVEPGSATLVNLVATASDGTPSWSQVSGPSVLSGTVAGAGISIVGMPLSLAGATIVLRATVTTAGGTAADDVTITVLPATEAVWSGSAWTPVQLVPL